MPLPEPLGTTSALTAITDNKDSCVVQQRRERDAAEQQREDALADGARQCRGPEGLPRKGPVPPAAPPTNPLRTIWSPLAPGAHMVFTARAIHCNHIVTETSFLPAATALSG